MEFTKELLDSLLKKAKESPRLRTNLDLRTTSDDTSQRMLNALIPGTQVPIHRHEKTSETVICILGEFEEIFYEEVKEFETIKDGIDANDVVKKRSFKEISRHLINPAEGIYGIQVPANVWHSVNVLKPTVIFEAKDGAFVVK